MLPHSDGTIDLAIARRRMNELERRATTHRMLRRRQRTFLAANVLEKPDGYCCAGPDAA